MPLGLVRRLIPDHIAPGPADVERIRLDHLVAKVEWNAWVIDRALARIDQIIAALETNVS